MIRTVLFIESNCKRVARVLGNAHYTCFATQCILRARSILESADVEATRLLYQHLLSPMKSRDYYQGTIEEDILIDHRIVCRCTMVQWCTDASLIGMDILIYWIDLIARNELPAMGRLLT